MKGHGLDAGPAEARAVIPQQRVRGRSWLDQFKSSLVRGAGDVGRDDSAVRWIHSDGWIVAAGLGAVTAEDGAGRGIYREDMTGRAVRNKQRPIGSKC